MVTAKYYSEDLSAAVVSIVSDVALSTYCSAKGQDSLNHEPAMLCLYNNELGMEQVDQRSYVCPIPGSVLGKVGWGFGLVEGQWQSIGIR